MTTVQVTIDRSGRVDRAGIATMSGTVTCDQPASVEVDVLVTQRFNRKRAQGPGGTKTTCGPSPTAWTVSVFTFTSTVFGPGNAIADVFAFASNATGSATTELDGRLLHLHRAE